MNMKESVKKLRKLEQLQNFEFNFNVSTYFSILRVQDTFNQTFNQRSHFRCRAVPNRPTVYAPSLAIPLGLPEISFQGLTGGMRSRRSMRGVRSRIRGQAVFTWV